MAEVKSKVELLNCTPDPEKTVALAAKLCYSDSSVADIMSGVSGGDVSNYIKKLISFGHLSPVEHACFTFGIEGVSRTLLAQLTRHRIASFSVKSQRYVPFKEIDYIIPPSVEALGEEESALYKRQIKTMEGWYKAWFSKLGGSGEGAAEDARFILPQAAETKIIMTMNARELLHFFNLRCCNRAQWEIRGVAWKMLVLVKNVAPNIFENAGPGCISGACGEGKMTCGKPFKKEARNDN
jgi:thymidylate synthase (FAD)